METTEKQIDQDVEALKDDVSNLRGDFAALLQSLRGRAKNIAADGRQKARKLTAKVRREPPATDVYVEEPAPGRVGLVVKRYRLSGRTLLLFFTLGMVTALLATRKGEAVVVKAPKAR